MVIGPNSYVNFDSRSAQADESRNCQQVGKRNDVVEDGESTNPAAAFVGFAGAQTEARRIA